MNRGLSCWVSAVTNTVGAHSTRPARSSYRTGRGERTGEVPDRSPDRARAVTVLVAEDEESFVDALVIGLGREGFDVSVARDGPEGAGAVRGHRSHRAPRHHAAQDVGGVDACRAIRARSHVPIIMVTAKGTEIDTVVGLEVGADDYVTKPYRLREAVARMRAVLRRAPLAAPGAQNAADEADRGAVLEVGAVRVDHCHRVFVRGQEVHLRRKEFELLVLLVENSGRVLTRDTLIDRVWGADYVGDTKTLDVHIKRLRTHVEADPSSPQIITTVRVGYRFEISADE